MPETIVTEPLIGEDPNCRYQHPAARHVCRRSTGEPVRPGEDCFAEARAQVLRCAMSAAHAGPSSVPCRDHQVARCSAEGCF